MCWSDGDKERALLVHLIRRRNRDELDWFLAHDVMRDADFEDGNTISITMHAATTLLNTQSIILTKVHFYIIIHEHNTHQRTLRRNKITGRSFKIA